MDYKNTSDTGLFKMEIDETAQSTFLEMARWTKFLAILGFIGLGLLVLLCVGMIVMANNYANYFGAFGAVGIAAIYLVFIGLMVYPVVALYQYSTKIKTSILSANKNQFNVAIKHLKGMFKYTGIIYIILIAVYGIIFIFAIAGMLNVYK